MRAMMSLCEANFKYLSITTLLLFSAFPSTTIAQEYDFRGEILGMDLEHFKQLPPLNKRPSNCSSYEPVPDGAPRPKPQVQEYIDAGVVTCTRPGDAPFPWSDPGLSVLGDAHYHFIRDTDGAEKLFEIKMDFQEEHFPDIYDLMSRKYGTPVTNQDIPMTNGFGANINGKIIYWKNEDSKIILISKCGSTQMGCIKYLSTRLTAVEADLVRAARSKESSRF